MMNVEYVMVMELILNVQMDHMYVMQVNVQMMERVHLRYV